MPNCDQTTEPGNREQQPKTTYCQIVSVAAPANHSVKFLKSKKKDIYVDLAIELKKAIEHKSNGDTNCNRCNWNNRKRIGKGTIRFGNLRTSREHPDCSINKIDQNTEKSPGNLRNFAITQTPIKKIISLRWCEKHSKE